MNFVFTAVQKIQFVFIQFIAHCFGGVYLSKIKITSANYMCRSILHVSLCCKVTYVTQQTLYAIESASTAKPVHFARPGDRLDDGCSSAKPIQPRSIGLSRLVCLVTSSRVTSFVHVIPCSSRMTIVLSHNCNCTKLLPTGFHLYYFRNIVYPLFV